MKESIITIKRKKTEIWTLVACFVVANAANVYSIAHYDGTSWAELYSSLGYVAVGALVLYAVWSLLRILFCAIMHIFVKKKGA